MTAVLDTPSTKRRHRTNDHAPVWISRPVENWRNIFAWADAAGIAKIMPPDQIHLTLATVRTPVDWTGLELNQHPLTIPAGPKPVQIFASTIKALTFADPEVSTRHAELLALFPTMDHPRLRAHVSLYKGGRMPRAIYDGEIVLGPERAIIFNPDGALGIKHVKTADAIKGERSWTSR